MAHATLDGYHFPIDPMSVSWDFSVKTSEENTLGGKVVQVLGTTIGDMTVSGKFLNWEQQLSFLNQVEKWLDKQVQTAHSVGAGAGVAGGQPLRFTFAPRRWDFHVHIKAFTGPDGQAVSLAPNTLAPPWTLTFFVVRDNTNLLHTIQDRFLARLMEGIGWKQTKYNGPGREIDAGAARDLLSSNFENTYAGGG